MRTLFLFIALMIGVQTDALAHTKSQSFSQWEIISQTESHRLKFLFSVDQRRITQLAQLYQYMDYAALLKSHLMETINVTQNNKRCTPESLDVGQHDKLGYFRARGVFSCLETVSTEPPQIEITSFTSVSPSHIHLARFSIAEENQEIVLNNAKQYFYFEATSLIDSLNAFIHLGFFHVISGLDHMIFLLALALFATRPRLAVLCITGFTLGHSLTLGLAFVDIITPREKLVEALIGLTIALTAYDVAGKKGETHTPTAMLLSIAIMLICGLAIYIGRLPLVTGLFFTLPLALFSYHHLSQSGHTKTKLFPLLTVAFGLVHGAGFAGGLKHINLDKSDILTPLIGFNLGVELAQLIALMTVYILIFGLEKRTSFRRDRVEYFVAPALFGLGLFWFAERILI